MLAGTQLHRWVNWGNVETTKLPKLRGKNSNTIRTLFRSIEALPFYFWSMELPLHWVEKGPTFAWIYSNFTRLIINSIQSIQLTTNSVPEISLINVLQKCFFLESGRDKSSKKNIFEIWSSKDEKCQDGYGGHWTCNGLVGVVVLSSAMPIINNMSTMSMLTPGWVTSRESSQGSYTGLCDQPVPISYTLKGFARETI